MLLPIGSSSELFTHPPPLFPTSRLYNIRPYHSKDKVGDVTPTHIHEISWKSKSCIQVKGKSGSTFECFFFTLRYTQLLQQTAKLTVVAAVEDCKPGRRNISVSDGKSWKMYGIFSRCHSRLLRWRNAAKLNTDFSNL